MNQPPSVQPARHKNITQCVQSMKQECIPSIGTGRYGWPLWLARGRPETSPSPLNGAESTSTSAKMCVITRSLSVFWRSKSSIVVAALFVTVFTAAVCVAFSVFVGITLIFVIVYHRCLHRRASRWYVRFALCVADLVFAESLCLRDASVLPA